MWALASALALAAPPPNVDLEDIDMWEDAAERLLDLPTGCWEWVGQASWDWRTGRYSTRGDAVFAGKTDNGLWGEVHLQPLGELLEDRRGNVARVYERRQARFTPLVGKLRGGRMVVAGDEQGRALVEGAEAVNVLRNAIRRISGDAFTSWAAWDDARGGVVLNRSIPLAAGRAEEIDVAIFFPSGGPVPSYLDVTFPAKFRTGRWPGWSVRDAEVHVRGLIRGNVVYPSSEAFRFDYRFLGFKYHGAQTVVYKRITRCELPISEASLVMPTLQQPVDAAAAEAEQGAAVDPAEPVPTDAVEDGDNDPEAVPVPSQDPPPDGVGLSTSDADEAAAQPESPGAAPGVTAEEALEEASPQTDEPSEPVD